MKIYVDKAQKDGKHIAKHSFFESNGFEIVNVPVPYGDYFIETELANDVVKRKTDRCVALKKMDFCNTYKTAVDTKFDIQELIGDICGKSHNRFRDECILAKNCGCKLYILVENKAAFISKRNGIYNETVRSIQDLFSWKNPRLFLWRNGKQKYPTATKGETLARACITMQEKYGVEFLFCSPEESGKITLQLLGCDFIE